MPNNFVLKEWAIIGHALETGQQNFIARKGGLRDEEDVFNNLPQEFYLQATYFHEHKNNIKPQYHKLFDALNPPSLSVDQLELSYTGVIIEKNKITTLAELTAIHRDCLFTWDYLKSRFDYGSEPGLWIIELNIKKLTPPLTFPMRDEYRGCKSWFCLSEGIP